MSELDAAIAKNWPRRWAAANDPTKPNRSKARNNLRRQYRAAMTLSEWQANHPQATCGTCDNCAEIPGSAGRHCDVESDFKGYVVTYAETACWNMFWKAQPRSPSEQT